MRRAAGIVVDRDAVWLAVEADDQLAAVYSEQIGSDDEDGYADRFSSLHEALGTPDAVGRLVGMIRPGGPSDGEVEIYVVETDRFDAAQADVAMIQIAPQQLAEVIATHQATDAAALIALQSILLHRDSVTVRPRTIWIGEDIDFDGSLDTFSVSWDAPEGHGEGPQQVSLEDALSWAQDHRSDVVLRIGDTAYGVPSRPVDDGGAVLPEWRGPGATSRDDDAG